MIRCPERGAAAERACRFRLGEGRDPLPERRAALSAVIDCEGRLREPLDKAARITQTQMPTFMAAAVEVNQERLI